MNELEPITITATAKEWRALTRGLHAAPPTQFQLGRIAWRLIGDIESRLPAEPVSITSEPDKESRNGKDSRATGGTEAAAAGQSKAL
jgi:hypothetical protein